MKSLTCPIQTDISSKVTLAIGGGGKPMTNFLGSMIVDRFAHADFEPDNDSAIVNLGGIKIGITTDSFVVSPIFFPGGNIGDIAVEGTVNDLLVAGVEPSYLSLGLILEEGFPLNELDIILESIRKAADEAGVVVVTGDTKVVEHGKGDKIFINTAGIGLLKTPQELGPKNISVGDSIIISGDIGRHGAVILSQRNEIGLSINLKSDVACLRKQIMSLINANIRISCMRDLTRGGLAASLVELSKASNKMFRMIDEIHVSDEVAVFCETLGLDPMSFANEGRFITIVHPDDAEKTLQLLKENGAPEPMVIGTVKKEYAGGRVVRLSAIGAEKIILEPNGEQLPRIC